MISDYRIYSLDGKQRLVFCTVCALFLGGCAYLFYNHGIAVLLFGGLAYPASFGYARYLAEKRRRELSYQFRDLLYALSSSFASGRQMREALKEAEGTMNLIYGDKASISLELESMIVRMEESGEPEETVLRDFALRSGIPDIISFSDIYGISKKTGGNMERVIRKAVSILLDRIDLERQVHTLTAQKRMEFVILAAMPLLVLFFLRITSGAYMEVLYQTFAGRILMTAALLAMGAAALMGIRMTRIRL